jgi:transcriptional regulator with XRE-family HTH domain
VSTRRDELAAFLRTRRSRIQPSDVGLPDGSRRRTPGLRREEVAQLAGVGVTWYTWLEQGRPIHVSVQVLESIARVLRLDPAERAHLMLLAEVPGASTDPASCADCPVPAAVQEILDGMRYPASIVTEMFDVLAWNELYSAIFPWPPDPPAGGRNTLFSLLTRPPCCNPVENRPESVRGMVAQLRSAYGRHVDDPRWTGFIQRMSALSPDFTTAWNSQDVARNVRYHKVFRHPAFGRFELTSTSFDVREVPGARLVAYTPADEASRSVLDRLAAGEGSDARFACWPTHQAELATASALSPWPVSRCSAGPPRRRTP